MVPGLPQPSAPLHLPLNPSSLRFTNNHITKASFAPPDNQSKKEPSGSTYPVFTRVTTINVFPVGVVKTQSMVIFIVISMDLPPSTSSLLFRLDSLMSCYRFLQHRLIQHGPFVQRCLRYMTPRPSPTQSQSKRPHKSHRMLVFLLALDNPFRSLDHLNRDHVMT